MDPFDRSLMSLLSFNWKKQQKSVICKNAADKMTKKKITHK